MIPSITGASPFRVPSQIPDLSLHLKNGDTLNLEKEKDFNGDVQKAMNYLQKFCNENTIRFDHFGWGYGELVVNNERHDINPYGIDLGMMLNFCGKKSSADFPIGEEEATPPIREKEAAPIAEMENPPSPPNDLPNFAIFCRPS